MAIHMWKRQAKGFPEINSSECDICKQASDMALYVLCDGEAVATLRFRHLGSHFIYPGDSEDISVDTILYLFKVQSCKIHEDKSRTKDQVLSKCKGHYCACPSYILFYSFLRLLFCMIFM